MGFKKINYHKGEEIFKVKIEDTTGATLESWVFMKCDFGKWVKTMKQRYGVDIEVDSKRKVDRDLEWAV